MDRAQGPEKFPGSSSRSNLCGAPPKDGPKWSIIPTRGIGGGDPGLEAGEFERPSRGTVAPEGARLVLRQLCGGRSGDRRSWFTGSVAAYSSTADL
mmetsp:Transcript_89068/g.195114  ORF Transcript_89068/g.195114 Transcript_89068/m.195114 type:complete len:96 (-) Transcript_89068:930-1217(-)